MPSLFVGIKSPYTSVEALRKRINNWSLLFWIVSLPAISLLNAVDSLGLNAKVVSGYNSIPLAVQAINQGEGDGVSSSLDATATYEREGKGKFDGSSLRKG